MKIPLDHERLGGILKGRVTMRVWAKVIKMGITTFSSINIAHAVFGFRQMGALKPSS